jgi:hypothetical protein
MRRNAGEDVGGAGWMAFFIAKARMGEIAKIWGSRASGERLIGRGEIERGVTGKWGGQDVAVRDAWGIYWISLCRCRFTPWIPVHALHGARRCLGLGSLANERNSG